MNTVYCHQCKEPHPVNGDSRTWPDWACRGCGHERKHCACKVQLTNGEQAKWIIPAVGALGVAIVLLWIGCMALHGYFMGHS